MWSLLPLQMGRDLYIYCTGIFAISLQFPRNKQSLVGFANEYIPPQMADLRSEKYTVGTKSHGRLVGGCPPWRHMELEDCFPSPPCPLLSCLDSSRPCLLLIHPLALSTLVCPLFSSLHLLKSKRELVNMYLGSPRAVQP